MANVNATTVSSAQLGIALTVAAQRAMDTLSNNLVLARRVSRDTDYAPAGKYSTLHIPIPGSTAVQDKVADTNLVFSAPAGSKVAVTLNKHKVVGNTIEDFSRAIVNPDLFAMYIDQMSVDLADAVEGDIYSVAAGFTATAGVAGGGMAIGDLRAAGKTLTDAKVPTNDRTVILSTQADVDLRSDTTLAAYFANSNPATVAEGAIARIEGFDAFVSQKQTAGGLAFHKNAIVLATRPLDDPMEGTGATARTVVDPQTGLAMRLIYSYSHLGLGHVVSLDILYGVAIARNNHAVKIAD